MSKVKTILAPTDFSEISKIGLRHAFELARKESAEVIVYHAIDFDNGWPDRGAVYGGPRNLLSGCRAVLDRFLAENFADCLDLVEVRQVVEFGAPDKSIAGKAADENADIIVMATHGRTGMDHFMLGSVAEKVIARARCPVLIVPLRAADQAAVQAA